MKELFYSGGSVVVSDEMATALLNYAGALAGIGKADVVEIPAVSRDGTEGWAQMLLGPSSQLWATPTSRDGIDLQDESKIAHLERRTAELRPAKPQPRELEPNSGFPDFE